MAIRHYTGGYIESLPLSTVINPASKRLLNHFAPDFAVWYDMTTNSPGFDANDAVLAEAARRGIHVLTSDGRPVSICRVDEPDIGDFSDSDAAAEAANLGYCLVVLPDFLPEQVGQPDGFEVGGSKTVYTALADGTLPRRVYAVERLE